MQVRSPGQLPTHLAYDAQGYLMAVHRGTGAAERGVDYSYDARGYMNGLTTRVDPTRTVSVVYGDIDGRGQPRDTTVPGIGATMSMEPDVAGAPISVSPPGQPAHGFEYSIIGQATEYRPPGVAEVPDPADCPAGATCTVYDIERRIDQVVQADGQLLDLTYNQATGQLTSVSVPDDGTYTFSYDPTSGNLNTVTGPPGTVSVQTLWQSDLPIASISMGLVAGRVDVTYNNHLEPELLEVTGGHGVRYTYDRDGLVVSASDASSPTGPALQLTRAALDGHVEQDVLGVVQTSYAVDVSATTPGYGDYEGSTVRVNGTPVYESHYEHDALGRITEWTETVEGSTRVQRFEYDDGGRLTSVRDGLDAPVADYGYDLNGNRTSVVESAPNRVLELSVNLGCPDSGGVPLARGANDRDELCRHGDHDYTYDANGRLQSRVNVANPQDETVYTYDGGGRLQEVAHGSTTIAYVHDALGRRVGRVVNGAFERGWLYKDSLNPIAQVNAAGVVEATYVYVTRANVPDYIVTTAGAVYRVVSDHLGSVRMLVNATTGAITERYDYDVWGRVTFESGDHSLHPFGYAGGLYDADTGLVRFGVRDYDADAGRWTAPEPLGFAAEASWYRYAAGDPVNFVDPNGLRHYPARDVMRLMQSIYHAYRNALPGTDFFILYGLHCGASVLDFYGNGATDTFEVPGRGTMTARDFGNYIAGYSGYYAGGDFGAYLSSMEVTSRNR
ncbi:MAG: hypothetical protein IPG81_33410 [Sandaracinaceae bacterium]|nr:hypothetical protein [Sandaracinaceae bacterium]